MLCAHLKTSTQTTKGFCVQDKRLGGSGRDEGSKIEKDNVIGRDHAYIKELPAPLGNGSFSYEIPARWRVMGDDGSQREFSWSNQHFSITADGTDRVSKFGLHVHFNRFSTIINFTKL